MSLSSSLLIVSLLFLYEEGDCTAIIITVMSFAVLFRILHAVPGTRVCAVDFFYGTWPTTRRYSRSGLAGIKKPVSFLVNQY